MQERNTPLRPNRRTLSSEPYYFGAFLNIARHNAFMVMQHLSAKYAQTDTETLTEETLVNARLFSILRKDQNQPDITRALIRDLKRYFPLLSYPLFMDKLAQQQSEDSLPFSETDPKNVLYVLQQLFVLLNRLRNHYSHYISTSDYSKIDFDPIKDIYRAAVFRLTDRGKHTKRFDVFEEPDVQHLLSENNSYQPKSLAEAPEHDNTIAFITCLFLERKYAFPFLSRLADFQNTTNQKPSKAMKATMECYTMFCCRLPQPKLLSSDILLDMINELGRCPAALYTVLSEEDKQQFHVLKEAEQEDQNLIDGLEPEGEDEDTDLEQEVILKRQGNRLPYFALRYFDDTNAFPNLRFDVYLGRWRTRPVYDKKIYGKQRERLLTKPIRAFTKLKPMLTLYEAVKQYPNPDTDSEKKILKRLDPRFAEHFHKDLYTKDEAGALFLDDRIEYFSPRYNFGDNVIGLKFTNTRRQVFPKTPQINNEMADAVISTHELRDLFFYHCLHSTPVREGSEETYIQKDVETFIKDHIERVRSLLQDVKEERLQPLITPPDYRKNRPLPFIRNNKQKTKQLRDAYWKKEEEIEARKKQLEALLEERYGLSLGQIPRQMKEYLLAYQPSSYKFLAIKKFKQQQDVVKELLKAAEKGRSPRVGEQATWLAEDIVFLTPPTVHYVNGKAHPQKLNNDQFRVLQSSLAYFSRDKDNILRFLQEETPILSSEEAARHPFLHSINIERCKGIFDFYLAYLQTKEQWLKNSLYTMKDGKQSDQSIREKFQHFLPSSVNIKKATERDYSRVPIYLPRGLFAKAIATALAAHPEWKVNPTDTAVYSLSQFLSKDLQAFYELPHYYRPALDKKDGNSQLIRSEDYYKQLNTRWDELKEKKKGMRGLSRDEKQEIKNAYKDVRRARARFLDREQQLRSLQADDQALWLMVQGRQRIMSEHMEVKLDKLQLRNIDSTLSEPVKVQMQIPDSAAIITDKLPLRRYGDLRRVAKDRRLHNLSLYYQSIGMDKIAHDIIKLELEQYDRRREGFFATIYQFEKAVYTKFEADFTEDRMNAKGSYFEHKAYLEVAASNSRDQAESNRLKERVSQLRNKFYHNEFPRYDWLNGQVTESREALFADRLFDIAEQYYLDMLTLL